MNRLFGWYDLTLYCPMRIIECGYHNFLFSLYITMYALIFLSPLFRVIYVLVKKYQGLACLRIETRSESGRSPSVYLHSKHLNTTLLNSIHENEAPESKPICIYIIKGSRNRQTTCKLTNTVTMCISRIFCHYFKIYLGD